MKVMMNTGGIAATNCFAIVDETSKKAVLFDAPNDTTAPLLDEIQRQGWDLVGLWFTHGHFDHIADHAVVSARFPSAKVLIHTLDAPKLRKSGDWMFPLPIRIPPREPDVLVEDGQLLTCGTLEFRVIHAPGHSPGSVGYYCAGEKVLVGGDLIIGGSIGRTDLPDSDHAVFEQSLRTVMKLPPETNLLPGHGDPSTLAEELRTNYYLAEIVNRNS